MPVTRSGLRPILVLPSLRWRLFHPDSDFTCLDLGRERDSLSLSEVRFILSIIRYLIGFCDGGTWKKKGNLMTKGLVKPSVSPLFAQIEELIVDRVRAGEWKPGEPLPSESEFAKFYGVSQGTVRKAVAQMAADNLVVRFRGKGTFVASHTDEREHSHFFHIHGDGGQKILPSSRQISCGKRRATREIEARLQLPPKEEVVVLERLRTFDGKTRVFESIVVASSTFPDLCANLRQSAPNELYPLYERLYGIRVVRAEERLKAVAADGREAELLGVAQGAPLLEIDRIAMTYGDVPVEWRRSHCNTADHYYLSLLR